MSDAEPMEILYTNHRGETARRRIIPHAVRYAATEWHPEPQWLLDAYDTEKGAVRSFAMRDIRGPEAELAAARAEAELLRGLNLLLNRGVVDATAEIERLKASSNRLWEEKIDILGHRDSFESQLSAARAEVERLKARTPGPDVPRLLAAAREAYEARIRTRHEPGSWPAFRDGYAAGLAARTPGPAMQEVLDLIRGCLDVAGVAEVIIDEETARAILAEHEAAHPAWPAQA